LLALADVVIAAEAFPCAYTGASSLGVALERLEAEFHPSLVVATLGAEGSLARCGGREVRTPGYRVPVTDTTGAGDAFRGGFVSGWLRLGNATRVDTLMEYANAVAALKCRALGAQAGLPRSEEVDDFVTTTARGRSNSAVGTDAG
jgi:sugar/nucleoside kinase (ribokinase family)